MLMRTLNEGVEEGDDGIPVNAGGKDLIDPNFPLSYTTKLRDYVPDENDGELRGSKS